MMLTILGATGKTGRHVLAQALAAGHVVTALARDQARLPQAPAGLRLVGGDVRDAAAVDAAVARAEAVLSVLGPPSNAPELAVSRGLDNVLAAMRRHGVRRLVLSVGAAVRDPLDRPTALHAIFGLLVRALTKNVYEDMRQAAEKVRASDLDWTLVRVPRLTDAPGTGRVRVGYVGKDVGASLARADLAEFMLRQLEAETYLRKAPAISN